MLTKMLTTGTAMFKILVLKKNIPLFLSWNITFRCNLRCKYCGVCDVGPEEMTTEEVKEGLEAVWDLGTRWITFSGGEPLIRHDIDEVLGYAKDKGFQVYISTNGIMIPKKLETIRRLDHVNISIDGSKETHDDIRGKGTFDKAVEAVRVCQELRVPVSLQCVVSKTNLHCIEESAEVARELGASIMYQPATLNLNSSMGINPLAPEPADYQATIDRLMEMKRAGAPIRNSLAGLAHIRHWPNHAPPDSCPAGRIMSIIEADGSVIACHRCMFNPESSGTQVDKRSVRQKFTDMTIPQKCGQCWCAPLVELGLVMSLRTEPIWNAIRMH